MKYPPKNELAERLLEVILVLVSLSGFALLMVVPPCYLPLVMAGIATWCVGISLWNQKRTEFHLQEIARLEREFAENGWQFQPDWQNRQNCLDRQERKEQASACQGTVWFEDWQRAQARALAARRRRRSDV